MKISQSFISNSSSSSFIATVAVVIDEQKFDAFEKHVGHTYEKKSFEEFEKLKGRWGWPGDFEDCLFVNPVTEDLKDKKFIYHYEKSGDDSDFLNADGDEYNYDIDLDFFSEEAQDIYSADEENGLKILGQTYYAGRDG
jgi:hypothetical protein